MIARRKCNKSLPSKFYSTSFLHTLLAFLNSCICRHLLPLLLPSIFLPYQDYVSVNETFKMILKIKIYPTRLNSSSKIAYIHEFLLAIETFYSITWKRYKITSLFLLSRKYIQNNTKKINCQVNHASLFKLHIPLIILYFNTSKWGTAICRNPSPPRRLVGARTGTISSPPVKCKGGERIWRTPSSLNWKCLATNTSPSSVSLMVTEEVRFQNSWPNTL